MMRKKVRISGFVQGVGFRNFTQKKAIELGVTGFVKNLIDGSVYVEAQGEKAIISIFISELKIGPRYGEVLEIKETTIPIIENEYGFRVSF
ncbi:MAG: acylphosphatase [Caldisericia bacterium]|nr:acylphosphatase [Caldisericia bacterium]